MNPSEIIEGATFFNRCNWQLRVDRVSKSQGLVNYTVVTGRMRGRSGTAPLDEFADRVVSRVKAPRERLTITESEK